MRWLGGTVVDSSGIKVCAQSGVPEYEISRSVQIIAFST